ncbi:DNA helicase [Vibrio phage 12VC501]|nr:DNA helicase [Vibrio phage 12VC501]
MKLNQDQEQVLKSLVTFMAMPSAKDIIVDAPAGCGKGYLINYIEQNRDNIIDRVKMVYEQFNQQFYYTATTNEAVSNLPSTASTIYSFTGVRPNFDGSFFSKGNINRTASVVIIDEASYIDEQAHKAIRRQLPNAKIIWVMDQYQLAPVKSDEPYIPTLGFKVLSMNTVERNKGHIQSVSMLLRDAVANKTNIDLTKYADGLSVELLSPTEFDNKIIHEYSTRPNEELKYLGFTNETVKLYNNAIHKNVFKNPSFPHVGARALINKYNDNIRHRVGKSLSIFSVNYVNVTLDYGIEITEVHLDTSLGSLILCDSKVPAKVYNPNKFLYSEITLPYACTVHKSQGQSIDTIFIDLPDIERCWDKEMVRRLKYVAWSRSINKIYLKGY